MALSQDVEKPVATQKAGPSKPLPSNLAAAGLERPELDNAPCVGVDSAEQGALEIEDSTGAVWVFPYSVLLYAKVWRENEMDILSVVIGGADVLIHGRGLRSAAEGLRRYRVVYLRPIGHDLVKTAPDKIALIERITVRKHQKGGNEPAFADEPEEEPLVETTE